MAKRSRTVNQITGIPHYRPIFRGPLASVSNGTARGQILARPWVLGEDMSDISVGAQDLANMGARDDPLKEGMVAQDPDNLNDQWFINKEYFDKNYEA